VLVGSITSLLKTVKSVEDAAARGLRALETAIEAIDTDLQQCVNA
jgi:talin